MKKYYLKPNLKIHNLHSSCMLCSSATTSRSNSNSQKDILEKQMASLEARINELKEIRRNNLPESINIEDRWNIFGINLKDCPNDRWTFEKVESTHNGNKMATFTFRIPEYSEENYNHQFPFKSVRAAVIDDKHTNFIFDELRDDNEKPYEILFTFIRNFVKGGHLTHAEFEREYGNEIEKKESYSNKRYKSNKEDDIELMISFSDNNVGAAIYTNLISPSMPDNAKNFVVDKYEVFSKNIEMVTMCIGMCQIYGERCGTEELVKENNQIAFYVINRDQLPAKDRATSSIITKGTPVKFEKSGDEFAVVTEDNVRIGYCPKGLHIGISNMLDNNFVKEASVYDNNNGDIAVIVTFELV